MEGINFVTDGEGRKIAVQIDLEKNRELWEDIYDSLIARSRSKDPRESLDSVKKRLRKAQKL